MKVQDIKVTTAEPPEELLESECVNIEDSPLFDPSSLDTGFDNLGEYAFETDHLALKNNTDYYRLMKTLAVLEGQRTCVIENIEKLTDMLEKSVSNPLDYVEKLQKGELFSPKRIEPVEVPVINWSKYGVNVPEDILHLRTSFHGEDGYGDQVKNVNGQMIVRGRLFDESKPVTFNQFWTPEEQRLLEELLQKYPPEPVELSRYRKIATEMGNRTPLQVQSRVQKFFIKLQKAGLPVPGRKYGFDKYHSTKRQRKFDSATTRLRNILLPSTFWGTSGLAVNMEDAESSLTAKTEKFDRGEEPSTLDGQNQADDDVSDVSDEDDVPPEMRHESEYTEILWLKFVKKVEKKQEEIGPTSHEGFKCDKCLTEPITGTRWHCTHCPEENSVDFCHMCAQDRPALGVHLSTHFMSPILRAEE